MGDRQHVRGRRRAALAGRGERPQGATQPSLTHLARALAFHVERKGWRLTVAGRREPQAWGSVGTREPSGRTVHGPAVMGPTSR